MNIYDLNRAAGNLAIEFCVKTFGTKPGLEVPSLVLHRLPSPIGLYGYYDSSTNKIHVYKAAHSSFVETMDTIVHEYTHYLQNLEAYAIFEKTGTPYYDNPYEIEAFEMGKRYKMVCKKYVASRLGL